MARFALYSSTGTNQLSSTPSSTTTAFRFSKQEQNNFPKTTTTPLNISSSNSAFKNATLPNDVYMDYELSNGTISSIRSKLNKTLNRDEETLGAQKTFSKYTKMYNRFKLPTVNDVFQKGFAHVFFTRPDCNVLTPGGHSLNESFKYDPEFNYAWQNNADLVKQLTLDNGQSHQFMLALSNKVASFSLKDEQIQYNTYGKSFKGWQISYGRNNIESKSADSFQVSFNDDRTLHIHLLHKLWVEYISDVYLGKKAPKEDYIRNRMLDYASSCYYILTAEDGETIIFWSKYYGIFPVTVPTTKYGWDQGNIVKGDLVDVEYRYSFKEDMNPESLVEFNMNANVDSDQTYVPTFDPNLGHVGTTWVGAPYIELVTNNTDPECPHTFKLRFSSSVVKY